MTYGMDATGASNAHANATSTAHPSSSSSRNRRRRKKKRSRQEGQDAAKAESDVNAQATSPQPTQNEVSSGLENHVASARDQVKTEEMENHSAALPQTPKSNEGNHIDEGRKASLDDAKKKEKAAVNGAKENMTAAVNNARNEEKKAAVDAKKEEKKAAVDDAKKEEKKTAVDDPKKEEKKAAVDDAKKEEKKAAVDDAKKEEKKAAVDDAKKEEKKAAVDDAKKEEKKAAVEEAKKEEKKAAVDDAKKEEKKAAVEEAKKEEKKAAVEEAKMGEKAAIRMQDEAPTKSKSQLRAERRAKQEAQRAAKAEKLQAEGKKLQTKPQPSKKEEPARKTTQKPVKDESVKSTPARAHKKSEGAGDEDGRTHPDEVVRVPTELRQDDPQQVKKKMKRMGRQNVFLRAQIHKKVALFSHLPQHQIENGVLPDAWKAGSSLVHPAFYRVGVQMAYGTIMGANNRCLALAEALTAFIESFQRPDDKEFGRFLESQFSPNITFLSECRPLSAGMRAFVKNFKANVVTVGRDEHVSDDARKEELKTWITDFIEEKIVLAGKMIAKNASGKISAGSCLLTFAFSSTVAQVFRHARHEQDLDFTVIVADCEPLFEGRRMVRVLESNGIPCEYVSLTGVASVMSRVSAVFIGAQAIFNNGSVLSRAGTGLVASIAEEFHRPLHVCCESYKFWERVQLDAFVYNDLGDPGLLVGDSGPMREEWKNAKSPLHYLNLLYDVTPPDLIDIVVTELCLMPSSSVPVVLRRYAI